MCTPLQLPLPWLACRAWQARKLPFVCANLDVPANVVSANDLMRVAQATQNFRFGECAWRGWALALCARVCIVWFARACVHEVAEHWPCACVCVWCGWVLALRWHARACAREWRG